MSSDATPAASSPAPAIAGLAAQRMALRIGFGAALGFVLAEFTGAPIFFLAPLLAVQLLASMQQPPTLRQGIGLVVLIAVTSGVTLLLAGAFASRPLVYVVLIAVTLFFGFLLDTAGKTATAGNLLTMTATIPLLVTQSAESATALAGSFIGATAIAVLTAWLAFAAFPGPPAETMAPPPVRRASPRTALVNTLLLFPVLLLFMLDGRTTFVVLMVIIAIIRQSDRSAGPRAMIALLAGNCLGGLVATIAFAFVTLQPSFVFFLLIVLLVGLTFGARAAAGGAQAPLFSIALASFVILLGIGVSPLPAESGEAFTARLWNVMLAGVYAVGAISLVSAPAANVATASSEKEPVRP